MKKNFSQKAYTEEDLEFISENYEERIKKLESQFQEKLTVFEYILSANNNKNKQNSEISPRDDFSDEKLKKSSLPNNRSLASQIYAYPEDKKTNEESVFKRLTNCRDNQAQTLNKLDKIIGNYSK